MVKEYKIDGVIDCSLKFCCLYDTEKYSVSRALKEAGIPVLSLETDYADHRCMNSFVLVLVLSSNAQY